MATADLHCHTTFSDGIHSPADVVKRARMIGLNALAITDHNTMDGIASALHYIEDHPFPGTEFELIPGCEVSTKQGHVIGIYLKQAPKKGMDAKYTIDEIHEQGGLAIAAHPYVPRMGVQAGLKRTALHLFDAVEIINASTINVKAQVKAVNHWMNNMGKYAAVGNSDAHVKDMVGMARTQYDENLMREIKMRQTGIRIAPRDLFKGRRV